MRWIATLRLRARSLFRRTRVDHDLDRELQFHVEEHIAELIASGLSAEEARATALRTFGNVTHIQQDCREARGRGVNLLDDLRHDARYAARSLARHPGFTIVALATLALGIGANTAIFSVVHGVLWKPLPYAAPEQLVTLMANVPASEARGHVAERIPARVTVAELTAMKARTVAVSQIAFRGYPAIMTMAGHGETTRVEGITVAPGLFELLGVSPLLGRTLGREEEQPDADSVIVLSYPTWQRYFDADLHVVGQTVRMANSLASPDQSAAKTYTIVGVMPERFAFGGAQVQFWMPSPWSMNTRSSVARFPAAPGA